MKLLYKTLLSSLMIVIVIGMAIVNVQPVTAVSLPVSLKFELRDGAGGFRKLAGDFIIDVINTNPPTEPEKIKRYHSLDN